MKKIIFFCFYIPLFLNVQNAQVFIAKFNSVSNSQFFAYLNIVLLSIGAFFLIKKKQAFSPLIKAWIVFYICYYTFSLIANAVLGTEPPILRTLAPLSYFFGFAILLSIPEQLRPVSKVLAISFFVSCILLIIFQRYNFSLDHDGVYEYQLDRAGGVYGDANNAAVAAILSFLFLKYSFVAKTKFQLLLKTLALLVSAYAFLLTFSKTGFMVFFIVLCLTYHKFFNIKRILFSLIFIPIAVFFTINWALTTGVLSREQKSRIESLVNLATFQTQKVSFSDRDVLLKNMMSYVYKNPYLGNGLELNVDIRGHNTLIGVWADAGILTFLVFIGVLIFYIKKALVSPDEIKYFALAVFTTLYIYMLSLQTIINQGNLMAVFVFFGYILYNKESFLKENINP